MKPSYGAVSRYGLIDLSMSLDQIGALGKDVEDVELVYEVIRGRDDNDATSRDFKGDSLRKNKVKIGVPYIKADEQIWDIIKVKVQQVCDKNLWKAKRNIN